jgi:hypothetical protein
MRVTAAVLFLAGLLAVSSFSGAQPPGGKDEKDKFGKGGFGGKGGFARPQPGQVLPAVLQDVLKLTDAQKKDLEGIQKDVDEKIAKILTEEQRKQLKEMREAGPGGFGGFPGGKGGGGGGKGEKKDDKKE